MVLDWSPGVPGRLPFSNHAVPLSSTCHIAKMRHYLARQANNLNATGIVHDVRFMPGDESRIVDGFGLVCWVQVGAFTAVAS